MKGSRSLYNLRTHRTLTGYALREYETNVKKYTTALHEIRSDIELLIHSSTYPECNVEQIISDIHRRFDQYTELSTAFEKYLKGVRTEDSETEASTNHFVLQSVKSKLETLLDTLCPEEHDKTRPTADVKYKTPLTIKSEIENAEYGQKSNEQKSTKSKSKSKLKSKLSNYSQKSDGSQLGTMLVKQKTKLEELKVRMKYAQKEAELLKQKTDIEVNMKMLHTEREVEECERGLSVLNECLLSSDDEDSVKSHLTDVRKERVHQYVNDQNKLPPEASPKVESSPILLNANCKPFVPTYTHRGHVHNTNEDMAKFIVKKDLLLSRIQKFNDQPEYFGSWKKSFLDTVAELELSPTEELDLLVKWLGPKSAVSIRASNFMDPSRARDRIWERLHDRFARPEMVESSVKTKLANFLKITAKEPKRLYDLVDIVSEIESIKEADEYRTLFSYYDSSAGVNPIVLKLPYPLQEKWTTEADKYKVYHGATYPPFHVFVTFLGKMARMKNDPSFIYEDSSASKSSNVNTSKNRNIPSIAVRKTGLHSPQNYSESKTVTCPLHQTNHTLNKCFQFREKPLKERQEFIKSKGICFKCCGQKNHLAKDCKSPIMCGICKSTKHPTALHVEEKSGKDSSETTKPKSADPEVTTNCTQVCRDPMGTSKSCAKTVLVRVHHASNPQNSLLMYAIIDEQSNKSLARSALFDHFNVQEPDLPYSLSSCSGTTTEHGRRATNFVVESLDSSSKLNLPVIIECDHIPNVREEIPSPDVAAGHTHLKDIVEFIPRVHEDVDILLLIGRDLLQAHHVLEQKLGPVHLPYAQKLYLGWVIVGETCLSALHTQDTVSVMKTFTLKDGRTTLLEPCTSDLHAKDIFVKTSEDDKPGLSIEDKTFLAQMEKDIYKDENGLWTAPLPFRKNRQRLPNNRSQALKRARLLDSSLEKNPVKRDHVFEFMNKILSNDHAEIAPAIDEGSECWYLPLFAVYHPKKPGSVRCVFDSSAKFEGMGLNDVLLTGPDLVNSLLGILFRFRQYPIAISADIEQMFYRFAVPPDQRNYLRFFWHRDNKPENELIEYRMNRHVFGNAPSPAVATVGLRKSVEQANQDVRKFVERDFYVDDGLASFETALEAVSLLARTQKTLKENGDIRLHKISSNSLEVLESFHENDLSKDIKDIDLDLDQAPLQRSLGVIWDMSKDYFTFQVCRTPRPFTKRGLLSTINSLYDPIGIVAPVTVYGKTILRDVMSYKTDWDEPLPETFLSRWKSWESSLVDLESVYVSRCYSNISSESVSRRELHVFSDASQTGIGAVAYLKTFDINGSHQISFVHGKAKVAPVHGHTIPRLELCAAVLAVNLKDSITRHLTFEIDSILMHTDSRIV